MDLAELLRSLRAVAVDDLEQHVLSSLAATGSAVFVAQGEQEFAIVRAQLARAVERVRCTAMVPALFGVNRRGLAQERDALVGTRREVGVSREQRGQLFPSLHRFVQCAQPRTKLRAALVLNEASFERERSFLWRAELLLHASQFEGALHRGFTRAGRQ